MDEPVVRVFISHSSKTPESIQYRDRLCQGLKDASFEAFLDSDVLLGGDDWRQAIFRFLDEAHAAVILISDEAERSHWVGIEASILAYFTYRKRFFKLVPVVLKADLDHGFLADVLGGNAIRQMIRPASPEDALQRVVRSLSDKEFRARVKESIPPKLTRESFVADELNMTGFGQVALSVLIAALRQHAGMTEVASALSDPPATTEREACERVASLLMDASFKDACAILGVVNSILAQGRREYRPRLSSIAETLLPNWISPFDAQLTAARAREEMHACRTLVVGTEKELAIRALIRRAQGSPAELDAKIIFLTPPAGEATLTSFRCQMRNFFQTRIDTQRGANGALFGELDDEDVKDDLATLEAIPQPVVVVFPAGSWPLDADFMAELRAEFPTPALLFAQLGNRAAWEPPVDALRELNENVVKAAMRQYRGLVTALRPAEV